MASSLVQIGATSEEFYTDCDLTLGTVINVWGRNVVLCDCDHFTKEYYRSKYGIGESLLRLCCSVSQCFGCAAR